MTSRLRRSTGALALAAAAAVCGAATPSAHGQATWRLEQPDPPPGARFKVPLGAPGDLQCLGASRCLLSVEGNSTVPRGLLFFDGARWRQLSTVCGDGASTSRIAWASPTEFWTVTSPSLPRVGQGTALCRFKDGQVVGSFSTPNESTDPFRQMSSAACDGPNNCWFGGIGSQDPSGARVGAFHLHWDGSQLRSVYGPQGRGTSDIVPFGGLFWETTFMGVGAEDRQTPVPLGRPEVVPQPVHTITGERFANEPYSPTRYRGAPAENGELLSADAAGDELWFGGGGASSGPAAPGGTSYPRPPLVVRRTAAFLQELPLPEDQFSLSDRIVDLAVVPGTSTAWAAVQPYEDRGDATAKAKVARIAADGSVEVQTLPASGAGRGAAARIEMTGPDEGWMITTAGWLFHLTDGRALPVTSDAAFANLIDFRPNEAAAQSISDAPPADDSQLFAPPPSELPAQIQDASPTEAPAATPLKAALYKIAKPKVSRRFVLTLSFTARRTVDVGLRGLRKGRIVARTKIRRYKRGRHTLTMKLDRRRYPTALRFVVRETGKLKQQLEQGGGDSGAGDTSGTVVVPGE
jgi:hypothetical protein